MEILRYRRDAWGQEVLEGVSWDLLWPFVALGVVLIVAHLLYKRFLAKARK